MNTTISDSPAFTQEEFVDNLNETKPDPWSLFPVLRDQEEASDWLKGYLVKLNQQQRDIWLEKVKASFRTALKLDGQEGVAEMEAGYLICLETLLAAKFEALYVQVQPKYTPVDLKMIEPAPLDKEDMLYQETAEDDLVDPELARKVTGIMRAGKDNPGQWDLLYTWFSKFPDDFKKSVYPKGYGHVLRGLRANCEVFKNEPGLLTIFKMRCKIEKLQG